MFSDACVSVYLLAFMNVIFLFVYFFRTVTNKNERAMCTNIITELRNYQFFSIAIFIIVTVSVSYQVTGVLMYNYHQQL